jgi:Family of unknown function (DUF5677)
MARWRTLHKIAIVSAVIAKYGEEIAERYVYYQIVESWSAIKAYERDHTELGFRPIPKRLKEKVRRDHEKAVERFGKRFKDENGWAAHHLKVTEKETSSSPDWNWKPASTICDLPTSSRATTSTPARKASV